MIELEIMPLADMTEEWTEEECLLKVSEEYAEFLISIRNSHRAGRSFSENPAERCRTIAWTCAAELQEAADLMTSLCTYLRKRGFTDADIEGAVEMVNQKNAEKKELRRP